MRKRKTGAILGLLFLLVLIACPLCNAAGEHHNSSATLKGKITTEPIYREECLTVGTGEGIYHCRNGDLKTYIETPPVEDFTRLNNDTAVAILEEEYFPNVKCYDLSSGNVQWSYSHVTKIYNPNCGKVDKQVQPFDVETLGRIDSDDVKDVAISAGHDIISLSGSNGKELWRVSHGSNIWELTRIDDIVFAGTQDGYLYAVNRNTGEVEYKKQYVKPFDHRRFGDPIPRSVWNIEPVRTVESTKVALSTEDGRVLLLNPDSGEKIWGKEVIQYNEELLKQYYRDRGGGTPWPTLPSDSNFFNLKINVIEDADGDGGKDIVAAVDPNPRGRRGGRYYQGTSFAMYLIDGKEGKIKWQNKGISFKYAANFSYASNLNEGSLLFPSRVQGDQKEITVLNVNTGTTENSIQLQYRQSNREIRFVIEDYLCVCENRFVLAPDYGDLTIADFEGDIFWSLPRLNDIDIIRGDFTGAKENDFLIYSKNNGDKGQIRKSRGFYLLEGSEGAFRWSKILTNESYMDNGPFCQFQKVENVLGNGNTNILTYRQADKWMREQKKKEDEHIFPSILLISGEDGATVRKIDLNNQEDHFQMNKNQHFFLLSVDPIGDVNRNGSSDVIVGARGRVFVTDLNTGDLLWERKYGDREGTAIFALPLKGEMVEKLNKGTLPDFLEREFEKRGYDLSKESSVTATDRGWKIEGEETKFALKDEKDKIKVLLNPHKVWDWINDWETAYRAIDDVNGDGINELVTKSDDKTLIVLESERNEDGLKFSRGTKIELEGHIDWHSLKVLKDFNEDGWREIICTEHFERQNPRNVLISPKLGEVITSLKRRGGLEMRWGVGDFNGNGSEDSLLSQLGSDMGPKLSVLDGESTIWSYQYYDMIGIEKFGYSSAMPACSAGDLNGDGTEELALLKSAGWRKGTKLDIYNLEEDKLLKTVTLEEFEEKEKTEVTPGILSERISDLTGDGFRELGVATLVGDAESKHVSFFAVDIKNGEVIASYDSRPTDILNLGTGVGVLESDGSLNTVQIGKGVTIDSVEKGSPLKLEWSSKKKCVTTVLVNGNPGDITTGNSSKIRLPPGKHEITVKATDRDGVTTYDSVYVEVEEGAPFHFALYAGLAIFLSLLFLPNFLRRLRRR